MNYGISLVFGFITGVVLFGLGLFFNPLAAMNSTSKLSVPRQGLTKLSFSSVPANTLLMTNDGESIPAPYPRKVMRLWEPTIEKTSAMVVLMANARGETVGIGVKFWSHSENTQILSSRLLVDSVWHIHLPGRGTFLISQQENYWSYLHDVVASAHRSSGDSWRGKWHDVMTTGADGPGAARVNGGNGAFANIETEATESRTAVAYSVTVGPVGMSGDLTIVLPD